MGSVVLCQLYYLRYSEVKLYEDLSQIEESSTHTLRNCLSGVTCEKDLVASELKECLESLWGKILDLIDHEVVDAHPLDGIAVIESFLEMVYDIHEVIGILL